MHHLEPELRGCTKIQELSFQTSAGIHVRLLQRHTGKAGAILLGDS